MNQVLQQMGLSGLTLMLCISFNGCSGVMESTVREGRFNDCPNQTVDQLFGDYLSQVEWTSFFGDDGEFYVDCSGYGEFEGAHEQILIQFIVDGDEWEVNAFEVNDSPLSEFDVDIIIDQMCSGL